MNRFLLLMVMSFAWFIGICLLVLGIVSAMAFLAWDSSIFGELFKTLSWDKLRAVALLSLFIGAIFTAMEEM